MTHAERKRDAPPVAPATRAGVRKIPMPTTRLTTTIAVSNALSVGVRRGLAGLGSSAGTQRFHQEIRQSDVLRLVVVELRGDADQLAAEAVPREEPRLDAALTRPCRELILIQPIHGRARLRGRQRDGGHRADHDAGTG